MAPLNLARISARDDFDPDATSDAFRDEWTQPSNYAFTILLLVGGDVVRSALAQVSGGWIAPVAFSFGWVSYATSAVQTSLGECKLMPSADTPCTIINANNGNTRSNGAWVLGRMLRDYEYWMGPKVKEKQKELIDAKWKYDQDQATAGTTVARPRQAGLVISFWEPCHSHRAGKAIPDILFWSGIIVSILQLGIAAIPCGLNGDWGVLTVTGAAQVLCFLTGSLRQWRTEKWACRHLDGSKSAKKKNFVLTRGNGAQHAIVIISGGRGLDLEDLGTGFENLDAPSISKTTRACVIVLGVCWVALLITSSALTASAWFLIAVGGIGMLQNMFVAGFSRKPEALGIPLRYLGVEGDRKVMKALMAAERRYKNLGKSMKGTFFPGGKLFEEEEAEWKKIADQHDKGELGEKLWKPEAQLDCRCVTFKKWLTQQFRPAVVTNSK